MRNPEEDEEMSTVLVNEYTRLDIKKLKARSEVLKTDNNGTVLLHREDPDHAEWFAEDEE